MEPLHQLQRWLAACKDLTITADQTLIEGENVPIRRVRVEWEYTSCVIEKIWQGDAPVHAALRAAWMSVWGEMGAALQTAPQLSAQEIDEHFDDAQLDTSVYDPERYRPDWLPHG